MSKTTVDSEKKDKGRESRSDRWITNVDESGQPAVSIMLHSFPLMSSAPQHVLHIVIKLVPKSD